MLNRGRCHQHASSWTRRRGRDDVCGRGSDSGSSLGPCSRVTACTGQLFDGVGGQRFDSLVFNMPLMHRAHHAFRHSALDDVCGAIAAEFFRKAPEHLKSGGCGYFTYSNLSDTAPFEEFGRQTALSLVAAEWDVGTGFWLMAYRFVTGAACGQKA